MDLSPVDLAFFKRDYSANISAIDMIENSGYQILQSIKTHITDTYISLINTGTCPFPIEHPDAMSSRLEREPNINDVSRCILEITGSGFDNRVQCKSGYLGLNFTNYYIFRLHDEVDENGDIIYIKIKIDPATNVVSSIQSYPACDSDLID
jgi:hypothetical protein